MKHLINYTLVVILVAVCLTACACSLGPINKIKAAILEHGTIDNSDSSTKNYLILYDEDGITIEINFYGDSQNVVINLIQIGDEAFAYFILTLSEENISSGIYPWSLSFCDTDMIYGKLYANRVRTTSIASALVEEVDKRSNGSITDSYAAALNEYAKLRCELVLSELQNFIRKYTTLSMTDLGFIGYLSLQT